MKLMAVTNMLRGYVNIVVKSTGLMAIDKGTVLQNVDMKIKWRICELNDLKKKEITDIARKIVYLLFRFGHLQNSLSKLKGLLRFVSC